MSKLSGKKALVKVSGSALTLTGEATTDAGAHTVYQITNAAKRVLDPQLAVTVDVNGSPTALAHTVNRLNGTITFTAPNLNTDVVTVTGSYLPQTTALSCTEWTLQLTGMNADVSEFGDIWVERLSLSKDASGSVKSWRDSLDTTWETALIAGNPIVIALYTLSTNPPDFLVWALLNKQQVQAAIKSAQSQSIDWEGAADADNRVISSA